MEANIRGWLNFMKTEMQAARTYNVLIGKGRKVALRFNFKY